jgi:hypothetical protein
LSHWAVALDATVKLITGAVERMASDKGFGRAEAMRQSTLISALRQLFTFCRGHMQQEISSGS